MAFRVAPGVVAVRLRWGCGLRGGCRRGGWGGVLGNGGGRQADDGGATAVAIQVRWETVFMVTP